MMTENCAKEAVPNGDEDTKDHADTAKDVDLVLTPDAVEFFLAETKLKDVQAVEKHILKIQSEAAKVCALSSMDSPTDRALRQVYPYPCIRRFDFVK